MAFGKQPSMTTMRARIWARIREHLQGERGSDRMVSGATCRSVGVALLGRDFATDGSDEERKQIDAWLSAAPNVEDLQARRTMEAEAETLSGRRGTIAEATSSSTHVPVPGLYVHLDDGRRYS